MQLNSDLSETNNALMGYNSTTFHLGSIFCKEIELSFDYKEMKKNRKNKPFM